MDTKIKNLSIRICLFLSLEQDDLYITISPLHQDSLDGSTGISLPDNSALEFKYDKSISDEELGKP